MIKAGDHTIAHIIKMARETKAIFLGLEYFALKFGDLTLKNNSTVKATFKIVLAYRLLD